MTHLAIHVNLYGAYGKCAISAHQILVKIYKLVCAILAPLPEIVIRLRSIIEVGTFTDVLG